MVAVVIQRWQSGDVSCNDGCTVMKILPVVTTVVTRMVVAAAVTVVATKVGVVTRWCQWR